MEQHSFWDEALCLVGHWYLGCPWLLGSPVLAQLERKQAEDRSSEKCFHGGCMTLPIVADMNLSYAAKSPNSRRGVIFNLNYIVDSGRSVYGSVSLLALRV